MTNFTESGITPVQFVFDRELIEKLDGSGPRYTSYPTADRFTDAFSEADYHHWLKQRQIGACARGVSLYAHIPFCNTVCYYCACNKIITKDKSRADTYLDYLERELALHAEYLQGHPQLAQLHFGGGTPTFLSDAQMTRLMQAIGRHFQLVPHGEYSIEIDPRQLSDGLVALRGGRLLLGLPVVGEEVLQRFVVQRERVRFVPWREFRDGGA